MNTQLRVFCYSHGKQFDKMEIIDLAVFDGIRDPLPLCSAVSVRIKLKPESSGYSNSKNYIQMWQRDTLSFLWFLLGFRKIPRNSPTNLLLPSHWPESRCIRTNSKLITAKPMSFVLDQRNRPCLDLGEESAVSDICGC